MRLLNMAVGKVKAFDMFSSPVTLTYDKKSSFKSIFGGLYSVLVCVMMIGVSVILFQKLSSRSIQRSTLSKTFINTFDDSEPKKFMENGPTFVFKLTNNVMDTGNVLPSGLGDLFIIRETVSVDKNGIEVYNITLVPSVNCNITEITKDYGELERKDQGFSIWFKDNNETIYGANTSIIRQSLRVMLNECTAAVCYSDQELIDFIFYSEFRVYIINKYYDFNDIDNPIKTYLDESRVEYLHPFLKKRHRLNIRENRIIQNDGIFPWSQQKKETFYSVSTSSSTFSDRDYTRDYGLAEFEISLDSQVDLYEREVYTILSFFGEIGGIFELLMVFGHIFFASYSKLTGKLSMVNHASMQSHLSEENFLIDKAKKFKKCIDENQNPIQKPPNIEASIIPLQSGITRQVQSEQVSKQEPKDVSIKNKFSIFDQIHAASPWLQLLTWTSRRSKKKRRLQEFKRQKKSLADGMDVMNIITSITQLKESVELLKKQQIYRLENSNDNRFEQNEVNDDFEEEKKHSQNNINKYECENDDFDLNCSNAPLGIKKMASMQQRVNNEALPSSTIQRSKTKKQPFVKQEDERLEEEELDQAELELKEEEPEQESIFNMDLEVSGLPHSSVSSDV